MKKTITFKQLKRLVRESSDSDSKFEADLESECKKRLEEYAHTFGYKSGAELEAAMDKDDDLYQEVIATDDGDNFLDLYLNWWPDVKGFADQDEYYHEPLDSILKGIIYGTGEFEADLEAEYKKRLEKYANTFGYKNGKELEAAMDADDDLFQEVVAHDDGDNFLDLYLNWWPDEEGFAAQDEYYHASLRDLLEGIVYGNDETDESVKESSRIGKDCYAVNFRNMRTAVHGLFIGTKREMEEVMDILDQIKHTDDQIDLEILYDELGKYDTIEEINFRDIEKDYTYRDWKTDKTYEVLNSSCYDIDW